MSREVRSGSIRELTYASRLKGLYYISDSFCKSGLPVSDQLK